MKRLLLLIAVLLIFIMGYQSNQPLFIDAKENETVITSNTVKVESKADITREQNLIKKKASVIEEQIKSGYCIAKVNQNKTIYLLQDKRIQNQHARSFEYPNGEYKPLILYYINGNSVDSYKFEKTTYGKCNINPDLFYIEIDYTSDFGSYSGPALFVFKIEKGRIQKLPFLIDGIKIGGIGRSGKAGYNILNDNDISKGILYWTCYPVTNGAKTAFEVSFIEFSLKNSSLCGKTIAKKKGILEELDPKFLKSLEAFQKFIKAF